MMKLSSILKMLMKEQNLNESELARRTGIGQPVIHRIASGETDNPKVATLSPIANYFAVSISQLIGDEPLSKDRIPGTYNPNVHCWSKVPLLTWELAVTWPDIPKQIPLTTRISTDAEVSELAYALVMKDTTMAPRFPEGTILIIDPQQPAEDKDFVVVHLGGQRQAIFKQLLIDGDQYYLKPLNTDFNTILLDAKPKFLGVMIQARMDYKKAEILSVAAKPFTNQKVKEISAVTA